MRTFRRIDPQAASRIADKEIAMKARLVKIETAARLVRLFLIAAIATGLVTVQCVAHRSAASTVEEARR